MLLWLFSFHLDSNYAPSSISFIHSLHSKHTWIHACMDCIRVFAHTGPVPTHSYIHVWARKHWAEYFYCYAWDCGKERSGGNERTRMSGDWANERTEWERVMGACVHVCMVWMADERTNERAGWVRMDENWCRRCRIGDCVAHVFLMAHGSAGEWKESDRYGCAREKYGIGAFAGRVVAVDSSNGSTKCTKCGKSRHCADSKLSDKALLCASHRFGANPKEMDIAKSM